MKKRTSNLLSRYFQVLDAFREADDSTIPFCAAEPITSRFVKSPFSTGLSDRYIKSGIRAFVSSEEFIGSQFIYPIYRLISDVCQDLFGAQYADPRPLSGMNAALTTLMSLTESSDRVLLLGPDAGGHESYPEICRRLSLNVHEIPFNYDKLEYDVGQINILLKKNSYRALVVGPSDLISPPPFEHLDIPEYTMLLYDCTQSFGLISAGIHPNPLHLDNMVALLGGTHKTLPGPTCGLILCNHTILINQLENKITPVYVRNPHPHHIASLLLTLVEFGEHGKSFLVKVVSDANMLAGMLERRGFQVLRTPNRISTPYTQTHQIHLSLSRPEGERIERTARRLNISLDAKRKRLFGEFGIRLGVQAVTRLGWTEPMYRSFADLLLKMKSGVEAADLASEANQLRGKRPIHYAIDVNEHGFRDE